MGISKAILAQASLVYNSVHIAIDHRLAIIDPPAIDHIVLIVDTMALSRLSATDHNKVLSLGLAFEKGNEKSKNVWIRDQLSTIFVKIVMRMRLQPHEVGIHPKNRDREKITAKGVCIRGRKVIASGFSHPAIGKLYAFEDDPTNQHIAKHTVEATQGDEFGNFDIVDVKVGTANWTHCNQFVNMVVAGAKCSDPDIPCVDGRIDSDAIYKDPTNALLSDYVVNGMYFFVFPSWVEQVYPWMPDCFQTAANQEMQVQEGTGFRWVYISISLLFAVVLFTGKCSLRCYRIRSDPFLYEPIGPDPIRPHPT